ncbi:MAG: hypothetical protein A2087_12945 [Spirochaetes bacterium GWD1_61_31]|nr:MAG: hypothetical protein A2Y37_05590 [Spirochaetes bacterium GWB1_60_80]OHD34390.1 MAG: hypothetical protein A2004_06945 [Spirochaetes bacterium GWC1_61_12]OHD35622.1 MAG: hypothetical protein A2087_12945 [Spirochaetes bacterium GWD1_61_31]OHD41660.1 MAG: hypothetical protein A2Y35_08960 [Spirochaetes bacterium GWE1_60_18]OHD61679.1 MAG: hypothetical protein A2Y32_03050 [Spirochaetes bacterium GWF1_60_12]HAP42902.1 phosphohydrolase [Spirochaetaceae bacterium]
MDTIWEARGLRFSQPVRDPLWQNIMLPAEFLPVVRSADFIKLGRIFQLGPAHHVYPGATHTRRAHSFGVFDLARRLLEALAARHDLGWLDATALRSFLLAALCHDLGHFPYTHSLKELPLVEHETLSAGLLLGPLAGAVEAAGADPALAAAIVDDHQPHGHPALGFLRSLLSGVLDPDKLDYLNRDAWACGVPYGTQDVAFILQHVCLLDDRRLAIDERGVMAVEALLFSKYQMYRAVYWHRAVRSATAMIKQAVLATLADGRLQAEALYGLDDAGFYSLMAGQSGRPLDDSGLIAAVFAGHLHETCYEQVFDPGNPRHAAALDLRQRPALAAALAASLGRPLRWPLVIDVPEPISFESALPVAGCGASFNEVSIAFGSGLVGAFEHALRIVRVFCHSDDAVDPRAVRAFLAG